MQYSLKAILIRELLFCERFIKIAWFSGFCVKNRDKIEPFSSFLAGFLVQSFLLLLWDLVLTFEAEKCIINLKDKTACAIYREENVTRALGRVRRSEESSCVDAALQMRESTSRRRPLVYQEWENRMRNSLECDVSSASGLELLGSALCCDLSASFSLSPYRKSQLRGVNFCEKDFKCARGIPRSLSRSLSLFLSLFLFRSGLSRFSLFKSTHKTDETTFNNVF